MIFAQFVDHYIIFSVTLIIIEFLDGMGDMDSVRTEPDHRYCRR